MLNPLKALVRGVVECGRKGWKFWVWFWQLGPDTMVLTPELKQDLIRKERYEQR